MQLTDHKYYRNRPQLSQKKSKEQKITYQIISFTKI